MGFAPSEKTFVEIDVDEIVHVTGKAILVKVDGNEVWIPKSQLETVFAHRKGDTDVTLSITEWIADQKRLR